MTRRAKGTAIVETQVKRKSRRGLFVCIVVLAAIGSGLAFAMTTDLPARFLWRVSSDRQDQNSKPAPRMGNIVREAIGDQCKQANFDNDTGRMVETVRPCNEGVILNPQGIPMQGTVRRIDAISKSLKKTDN